MARPLPTTKAQVSGHKFLRRRVEHGLVLGDIRMIHDPLARRRKALLFGGVGVAFLAVGSGMLAWLQPSPQPGDAPIVRSEQGQLFVDVNDTYHPVFNLASARIIAGQAAEAQTIGDEHLQEALLGSPVGISEAPGYLAAAGETPQERWTACSAGKDEAPCSDNPTSIGGHQVASQEISALAGVCAVHEGAKPCCRGAAAGGHRGRGGRPWVSRWDECGRRDVARAQYGLLPPPR